MLEDDYDGEFRYDVPPLNPLRSMPAAAGHVVYLGTSSKILSRGLRVSWAVLPARFRAAMAAYLDASGEEVSQVSAAFLASFIATGALTRHQSRAMRTYRARQERFVAACREHIPAARALGIEAGLHVALVFDRPLDDEAAAARLAGSGIGIGLQGKGTALIHRRDLPPLANLIFNGWAPLVALLGRADIFIQNFKPGGLVRFGLDYDSLKAEVPRLVYCSISGFGQTGPYAARAGYDFLRLRCESGEIDAMISAHMPSPFVRRSPKVRPIAGLP